MGVLTALTSVLETGVAKDPSNDNIGMLSSTLQLFKKTPAQLCWSGVFLWLLMCGQLVLAAGLDRPFCNTQGTLQWVNLQQVLDGDTLLLADGRKVRVIGINTPELTTENTAEQSLARMARAAGEIFFAADQRVGLKFGTDQRDRYGRLLAHAYRSNGDSLAAYLLSRGLGWHVVVPPNTQEWHCLQRLEHQAEKAGRGLWSSAGFGVKSVNNLKNSDVGFQRVGGVVQSVKRSKSSWWLQLGRMVIRLKDKDLVYFDAVSPQQWLHKPLVIRGWLVDRGRSKSVKKHGYSALMMTLRHPSMLEN